MEWLLGALVLGYLLYEIYGRVRGDTIPPRGVTPSKYLAKLPPKGKLIGVAPSRQIEVVKQEVDSSLVPPQLPSDWSISYKKAGSIFSGIQTLPGDIGLKYADFDTYPHGPGPIREVIFTSIPRNNVLTVLKYDGEKKVNGYEHIWYYEDSVEKHFKRKIGRDSFPKGWSNVIWQHRNSDFVEGGHLPCGVFSNMCSTIAGNEKQYTIIHGSKDPMAFYRLFEKTRTAADIYIDVYIDWIMPIASAIFSKLGPIGIAMSVITDVIQDVLTYSFEAIENGNGITFRKMASTIYKSLSDSQINEAIDGLNINIPTSIQGKISKTYEIAMQAGKTGANAARFLGVYEEFKHAIVHVTRKKLLASNVNNVGIDKVIIFT